MSATLRHVVLVGSMGSGKSTIGKRVAAALDRPFLDNDVLLEASAGMSAAEVEAREGVAALHHREAAVLLDAIRGTAPAVIAAAASTIEVDDVRAALRERAWVVWVRADVSTLAARLPGSPTRPFADRDPAALVREQAARRDPLFREVADVSFDTGALTVEEVVEKVVVASTEGCLPQYDP
jgi:shikimate kinase